MPQHHPLPKPFSVVIDALDSKGCGIGIPPSDTHTKSFVHVPGLLPNEEGVVKIEHISSHTHEGFARLLTRTKTSPHRTTPSCKAYGHCGGCTLQHLDYEQQLVWKRTWLAQALLAENVQPQKQIDLCVGAPRKGLYGRRHAKFVASIQQDRLVLGSYEPNSHNVVDMQGCTLIRPILQEIASHIIQLASPLPFSVYEETTQRGWLRYVILRETAEHQVQLTWVVSTNQSTEVLAKISRQLKEKIPCVASVVVHVNPQPGNAIFSPHGQDQVLLGEPYLWESINGTRLRLSARSFVQANHTIASTLYAHVVSALGPTPDDHLLDLYCGVGGIGLTALHAMPSLQLTGIEENPFAIADANATLAAQNLPSPQAAFHCLDAAHFHQALQHRQPPVSLVCLNPPRKGCTPALLQQLTYLHPRTLVYISCNPTTLARDLAVFTKNGYALTEVTPYDLHPHTPHVEALAVLHQKHEVRVQPDSF